MKISHSSDFAEPDTLLRQASMTASDYLSKAVWEIDEKFGEGYAANHPQLIAAFMQVAAIDFATATLARAMMYHGEQVSDWTAQFRRKEAAE
jgi:hypothetical protein